MLSRFHVLEVFKQNMMITVCLKKALYGCIQCAVLWYNELTSCLERIGASILSRHNVRSLYHKTAHCIHSNKDFYKRTVTIICCFGYFQYVEPRPHNMFAISIVTIISTRQGIQMKLNKKVCNVISIRKEIRMK